MIIGGNNNGNRNPLAKSPEFNNKFRQSTNTNFVKNNNPQQPINTNPYKDVYNTREMNERSYEMLKQRYNLDDLLSQLRGAGIKSIEEVDYAVLETSGKLSIFKRSDDSSRRYQFS